ncbi:MAG: DUF6273 domain-containing protein [bacterium]|nr:DUF6273 domain-containing protein [bacterium]
MKQMRPFQQKYPAVTLAVCIFVLGIVAWVSTSPCAAQYDPLAQAAVGRHVSFGFYPQDINGKTKPISWRVLQKNADSVLLISTYGLDSMAYDPGSSPVTWAESRLRVWLNHKFAYKAFTAAEHQRLLSVHISNPNNPQFHTVGGGDTDDKVFLLSIEEARKYFRDDRDRMCTPTAYALRKGAYTANGNGNCWAWLRSPGKTPMYAACIHTYGQVELEGCEARLTSGCVRPVIKVKL